MRTREEIIKSAYEDFGLAMGLAHLEVLLDIRDLLQEPPKDTQ